MPPSTRQSRSAESRCSVAMCRPVASVASDDLRFAHHLTEELLAFKTGVNVPRSRGDREEVFGGKGRSWRGAFVGGDLLVDAVTQPAGRGSTVAYGNFGTFSSYRSRADGLVPRPPRFAS